MISIDYQDKRPIYEQIADKLSLLILRGIIKPGEKLPSVRSLAVDLAINPNTIQKSYSLLERKGYVFVVKGRGSFAADCSVIKEKKQEIIEGEYIQSIKKLKKSGYMIDDCIKLLEETWRGNSND